MWWNNFPVGTRVKLTNIVDTFQVGIFHPGLTGEVAQAWSKPHGEAVLMVRLDKHHPELDEWNNELELWVDTEYPQDFPCPIEKE